MKGSGTVAARFGLTRRSVQLILGVLWLFDAALQLQPRMFGRELVTGMMEPPAQGQPWVIGSAMTHMASLVMSHPAVFNSLIAVTQLLIGAGLLIRRTVKPALLLSFAWVFVVWWFGEGLGMLLTGSASPLTGAPGAVLLYGVIGALVWPSEPAGEADGSRSGVGGSVAASGRLGTSGALAAWAILWTGSAVLWLLPANRSADSIHRGLATAAAGEPGWLAHYLTSMSHLFAGAGTGAAVVLAAASVVIGVAPILTTRPQPFLLAGILVSLLYWVTGQAFGGVLTGMGTDLNTGPLFALLGVALLPTVASTDAARAPVHAMLARNPLPLGAVGGGLVVALLASITSVAPAASATSVSSGSQNAGSMPGMSLAGGDSADSGMQGMQMGAMSAAERKAYDQASAKYPLAAAVWRGEEGGMQMQDSSCTTPPTRSQIAAAQYLVASTLVDSARYEDLSVAKQDGFIPITPPTLPVVHYVKPASLNVDDILNPEAPQSLVYANTSHGPVLAAVMYLMPAAGMRGPTPGGCLTQWHVHTNLCFSTTTGAVVGFTPCRPGSVFHPTPEMLHVWRVGVPGGALAADVPDPEVVAAAEKSN